MAKQIYTKAKRKNWRKPLRFAGLGIALIGLIFGLYTLSPLFFWELYLRPAFANTDFASPIPHSTIMTKDMIKSLLATSVHNGNWLPPVYKKDAVVSTVTKYSFSIPKLKIEDAVVSTVDTDINHHLVNFPGTAIPPQKGNAVIFGHSTLPQLYDPTNYKTIFANILNVKVGDKFLVTVNNTPYTYDIVSLTIVDPEDVSYLTQPTDDSYLTVVTCTPPGTIWKRLIIKSRLEKI